MTLRSILAALAAVAMLGAAPQAMAGNIAQTMAVFTDNPKRFANLDLRELHEACEDRLQLVATLLGGEFHGLQKGGVNRR